jgi:aa3 type cytochrome c oxidase subunit IV
MADSELAQHQAAWYGFTQFVTYGTVAVLVVVACLAIFLL